MEAEQILGGRYTLLDELGRGGTSVVWRARDEILGREVAVKMLDRRHTTDPRLRDRIRTEARVAAILSHPNIAQIHDYGESTWDGQCVPYVVMELVDGSTLQECLTAGLPTPREVFRICAQVAAALAAAHAAGLVHRDIKPANVMVTPVGAKVVDFGIAATVGPGEPEAELIGTPAYLAPERLAGPGVAPASDVYALGVLLHRLLAGESPWRVESTTELLSAHVHVPPNPLPPISGVPGFVVALVNRCLRKDPAERPAAADVAVLLARAERHRPARYRAAARPRAGRRHRGGVAQPAVAGRAATSERGQAVPGLRGQAVPGLRGQAVSGLRGQAVSGQRGSGQPAAVGRVALAERGQAGPGGRGRRGRTRNRLPLRQAAPFEGGAVPRPETTGRPVAVPRLRWWSYRNWLTRAVLRANRDTVAPTGA
ncbi:serine/threonine-protein kinase [Krasilnikovia cinnamomea]|uniref:non-specific serine/threonine protein kinase n=1 Tax=Krasilnikovia cinnamomea TaxID=349313 RepID=A0A4Q7ZIA4_9ACTN|nr:serine/threonine-protein kinase [Krasilnikovia cinnamomea]RZU49983.1 serine/threonine-protein kinase [Krasilnikovia cinnamomea]